MPLWQIPKKRTKGAVLLQVNPAKLFLLVYEYEWSCFEHLIFSLILNQFICVMALTIFGKLTNFLPSHGKNIFPPQTSSLGMFFPTTNVFNLFHSVCHHPQPSTPPSSSHAHTNTSPLVRNLPSLWHATTNMRNGRGWSHRVLFFNATNTTSKKSDSDLLSSEGKCLLLKKKKRIFHF